MPDERTVGGALLEPHPGVGRLKPGAFDVELSPDLREQVREVADVGRAAGLTVEIDVSPGDRQLFRQSFAKPLEQPGFSRPADAEEHQRREVCRLLKGEQALEGREFVLAVREVFELLAWSPATALVPDCHVCAPARLASRW